MKKRYTPPILRAVIFVSAIVFVASLFSANPVVYSDNPARLIESDDPLVLRQGNWTAQAASGASGGSYLYSSSPDDVLTLYFTGTTIEVVYVAGTTLGILALEVDGTVLRSVITTAETTQFGSRTKIDYLTDEGHTLRVYASQGVIAVDAFYANISLGYKPPLQDYTDLTSISSDKEPRLALLCDSGNQTVLVSRATGTPGTSGNDNSYDPSISYDGRYVAFKPLVEKDERVR
ncbi:MAG: hypothetical protein BroJett018_48450 [Chloroflexota bacterium]|nr:hypothetical protein [Chloroflexota bacterium]NOG65737.1 hypothetical protein [Chloroflexota bacterium]GIK67051.1 MAG: hypothetical protein BroJett018_48450 [Chloroflexota bacterium]